jgi:hypothetical protein
MAADKAVLRDEAEVVDSAQYSVVYSALMLVV